MDYPYPLVRKVKEVLKAFPDCQVGGRAGGGRCFQTNPSNAPAPTWGAHCTFCCSNVRLGGLLHASLHRLASVVYYCSCSKQRPAGTAAYTCCLSGGGGHPVCVCCASPSPRLCARHTCLQATVKEVWEAMEADPFYSPFLDRRPQTTDGRRLTRWQKQVGAAAAGGGPAQPPPVTRAADMYVCTYLPT